MKRKKLGSKKLKKIKYIKIPPSFVYPKISESDRTFGASLSGEILRPDGDWRTFLPPVEEQNIRGIESSACYIEGQQHTIATLIEEQFGIIDENYSARLTHYYPKELRAVVIRLLALIQSITMG